MDARNIAEAITTAGRPGQVRLRQAVVKSVADDGTLELAIGGSTMTVSGIHKLAHVSVIANDVVWLLTDGIDAIVIGKQS